MSPGVQGAPGCCNSLQEAQICAIHLGQDIVGGHGEIGVQVIDGGVGGGV